MDHKVGDTHFWLLAESDGKDLKRQYKRWMVLGVWGIMEMSGFPHILENISGEKPKNHFLTIYVELMKIMGNHQNNFSTFRYPEADLCWSHVGFPKKSVHFF